MLKFPKIFRKILVRWQSFLLPTIFLLLFIGQNISPLSTFYTEKIYYPYLFQIWRVLYDYTFGLLPFPSVYIVFITLFPLLYFVFYIPLKNKTWKILLIRSVNLLAGIYILFYLLWGLNYNKKTLATYMGLPEIQMKKADLLKEVNTIQTLTYKKRLGALGITDSITEKAIPADLESILRKHQKELFSTWNLPHSGRVRVRKLRPAGTLLRISTAGVYIPFASEGHIDRGLHPVQWPFTMAHEMAHGYGITDEGECNFVAFVTCLKTNEAIIQYSGLLGYFRYLLNNYRLYYREEYPEIYQNIDKVIIDDMMAINNQLDKYPDILPNLRDKIYDSYLKSHGIKDGLHSYSTIIQLVNRWKKSDYNKKLIIQTFPE